ncbi:MAG TPA: hypothetical protein VF458_11415 [Ktedonobacteraceae bacterium]
MEAFFSRFRKPLWGGMALYVLLAILLSACEPGGTGAAQDPPGCKTLGAQPVAATLPLPGQPFQALPIFSNQWIFVSLSSQNAASNGIAVLQQQGEQVCLKRVIELTGTPMGMALTEKGDLLLVADDDSVAVIDARQAEAQTQGALLGYVRDKSTSGIVNVGIAEDESYAFAINENAGTLDVFDFQRIRADDFNQDVQLAQISLGTGLLGMAVAQDSRYLYTTVGAQSEFAASASTCAQEGKLEQIDLRRLKQDPKHMVVARAAAGCDPGRVYLSADGATAWVTARGNSKIYAFNTLTLNSNPQGALVGSGTTGPEPVGLGIAQNGSLLLVANSNCYAEPHKPQKLSVLDLRRVVEGGQSALATLPIGACPREITVESDDQTVLIANSGSNTLTLINAARLPKPKN